MNERQTIVHVSDVHATVDGRLHGRIDGIERLRRVAEVVRCDGITPEAMVVSGDLIERGHAAAYPALRDALRDIEQSIGAPVLTVPGNHDAPGAMQDLPGSPRRTALARTAGRLRFLLLDSSSGRLGPDQLDRVREELRAPAGDGTILVLHHPPVPSPLPALAGTDLADGHELLTLLPGTDVRAILAGHFHHPLTALVQGVPVLVAPALAYHQVMQADPDRVSGYDLALFALIHVQPGSLTSMTLPLTSPPPLFTTDLPRSTLDLQEIAP